ncbi:MAG: site-specific DNA-methyltransferase [Bacteroidetes bacterium]|nr:site-specific DNA-methyltransferase [Bacteroidota bacterium]
MAKRINKATKANTQKPIEQYEHKDKQRVNNPPVGLVDAHTDKGGYKKKTYQYDPHLDPQLYWAGKAEHTSFDVPTVSLHVHERIDPRRIIETVKKEEEAPTQMSLFEEQKKPLREAIEFYKHKENWSNRLIAGDSLLVMNSLLEKEGMGGKVQMIYFDPPYGIKYGSNFQPFVNKKDVKDGNDGDLTSEPEMLKAFRDTWELGIHSYLTYMRDRLLLSKELLHESGSIFVQISDENVHHVKELLEEVFGKDNFVSQIPFAKTSGFSPNYLSNVCDYLIWYSKDKSKLKYRQLFKDKTEGKGYAVYQWIELENGERRKLTKEERKDESKIPLNSKRFRLSDICSQGETNSDQRFEFEGNVYLPRKGTHWSTSVEGLQSLVKKNRIMLSAGFPNFVRFLDDYPVTPISNLWDDTATGSFTDDKIYVVQTGSKTIQRCILMTTDPSDIVFDITCGSGTTAHVAENWGRRWMTCDTSRVALSLAKRRLMTTNFDYFELAHPNEGVGSGLKYESVPHITLKSLANNEQSSNEVLYDKPIIDAKKSRVTGPFTVEAVPAPVAKSFEEIEADTTIEADNSISRSGETLRQNNWIDELLKSGVRGKSGGQISFTRMESLSGTRFLQAHGETKEDNPKRVVVCFGPEHAPLEQRTVEMALEEARTLKPKPEIVLFCAFHFDSEARKDIEETNWPGITLLEAQMNADLLTDDLKKKRSSNESFWLIGQPDVQLKEIKSGDDKGKYTVEVNGFDYYNPKTGTVDSGGKGDIAMWMLDHDYDGRSLFPSQVFFPMAGAKEGWATLAKNLKAEIDEEKIEAFGGTVSLPFTAGKNVAVKIIDARGIESLKIIRL